MFRRVNFIPIDLNKNSLREPIRTRKNWRTILPNPVKKSGIRAPKPFSFLRKNDPKKNQQHKQFNQYKSKLPLKSQQF